METPSWGWFALVSYVPAPLGSILDHIRLSLPGDAFSKAHITILPPRALRVSVDVALGYTQEVLNKFRAFPIELKNVNYFPGTNVLYLDITQGSGVIHELHDALSTGPLRDGEQFEFRPHLTLGGPIPPRKLQLIQSQTEDEWRSMEIEKRFTIRQMVALWAKHGSVGSEWDRLWTYDLCAGDSRGAVAGVSDQTS